MTEPTGKYRCAETWFGSSDGLNERLVAEGECDGRRWALVRQWVKRPRYRDEEGEKYVLRIDLSEWWNVYSANVTAFYSQCFSKPAMPAVFKNPWGCLTNSSPGWWDNGFCAQLCYQTTLAKYASQADRFEQVVRYGFDFDSPSDVETAARTAVRSLGQMVEWFRSRGKPRIPGGDDF